MRRTSARLGTIRAVTSEYPRPRPRRRRDPPPRRNIHVPGRGVAATWPRRNPREPVRDGMPRFDAPVSIRRRTSRARVRAEQVDGVGGDARVRERFEGFAPVVRVDEEAVDLRARPYDDGFR